MRFLLRVDSHAGNHSAHPQVEPTGPISSGGAPRLPMQRRAPRVFCSGALRACLWALHAHPEQI